MPYSFLSTVLVRPRQAVRLLFLRFLRTCYCLALVQSAEGPRYPIRLEMSTPANSYCKLNFLYCHSICHRLKWSTYTTFFCRSPFCFLHEYGGLIVIVFSPKHAQLKLTVPSSTLHNNYIWSSSLRTAFLRVLLH